MDWTALQKQAPKWFRDAKFGIFLHWGVYSVPACENEWYSRNMYLKGSKQNKLHEQRYGPVSEFGYKDFIPLFKGEKFDPDDWAELIARSGARYAGPVSEHADNFSLWNSRVNPNNSCLSGPGRDVVGECARAFRERGIKFMATFHHQWLWGWFMSTDNEADVYDPANERFYGPALPLETNRYMPYRMPDAKFCDIWLEKIREVCASYKPEVLYFDSRILILPEEYRRAALEIYAQEVPDGVVTFKQSDFPEGTGVLDVECGRFAEAQPFPWQTDDRLEDNVTWCIVENPKYKSAGKIIQQLSDVASKNGCLLLNIGPRADGGIPDEARRELERVGDWLKLNGEAIYATRPFIVAGEGVTKAANDDYNIERVKRQMKDGIAMESGSYRLTGDDVRYTQTAEALYVIGFGAPEGGRLKLRALKRGGGLGEIRSAKLLGAEGEVSFQRDESALTLNVPESRPFNEAYVIKLERG